MARSSAIVPPNGMLIISEAFNLVPGYSANDKRVGGLLLVHFNRDTGRCDPGVDGISKRLKISRRSVLYSLDRICAETDGLFERKVHGGINGRNSYRPRWDRAEEISEYYRDLVAGKIDAESTPGWCKELHENGAENCTLVVQKSAPKPEEKTKRINQRSDGNLQRSERLRHPNGSGKQGKPNCQRTIPPPFANDRMTIGRSEAARESAKRRWYDDLVKRKGNDLRPIIDGITQEIQDAATEAELKQPGTGAGLIILALHSQERAN